MRLYGLIGNPVRHSFSKTYFTEKFRKEGLDCAYQNFQLNSIEEFPAVVAVNPQLVGLNVTSPFKQQIIPYLTEVSEAAREVNSVNVVRILREADGTVKGLYGYNSDVYGFEECLRGLATEGKSHKAIVCGTGGASNAACGAMRRLGYEVIVTGRTHKNGCVRYDEITPELMMTASVVVNATPLGMEHFSEQCPPLPYEHITIDHICIDMVYNPPVTPFMEQCLSRGAVVRNGLSMLLNQAEKSWELWNK